MIRDVVLSVEKHFVDNWNGDVNYDQTGYTPANATWIELRVIPILSYNASLEDCTSEEFELHLMAYGTNKVEAGELIEQVVAFLQNKDIDGLKVRGWRQIYNGTLDTGTYFYKLIFDAKK